MIPVFYRIQKETEQTFGVRSAVQRVARVLEKRNMERFHSYNIDNNPCLFYRNMQSMAFSYLKPVLYCNLHITKEFSRKLWTIKFRKKQEYRLNEFMQCHPKNINDISSQKINFIKIPILYISFFLITLTFCQNVRNDLLHTF